MMDQVWDVACQLREGDWVSVEYNSKRAGEEREMVGRVKKVYYDDGMLAIRFKRSDGQLVDARSDGRLHSIGSDYPDNGGINNIGIKRLLFGKSC